MNLTLITALTFFLILSCSHTPPQQSVNINAPDVRSLDRQTIIGEKNFLADYPATNPDGSVNVIVEIPAGTNEKWEVTKKGVLYLELRKGGKKKGKLRTVKYLSYPANYGMIPRTILSKSEGGDGDPLDVLILGPAIARGTVAKTRLIGVLKLLDRGEQDDKLITVTDGGPFRKVESLAELDKKFPGVTQILQIWFSRYKRNNEMTFQGFGSAKEARNILAKASKAFGATQSD